MISAAQDSPVSCASQLVLNQPDYIRIFAAKKPFPLLNQTTIFHFMLLNVNAINDQLPKFYYLCEDGVWGVRNACAECFVQVSQVCSAAVRHDDLTQLFVSLLCDQSRWVRHSVLYRTFFYSCKEFTWGNKRGSCGFYM